MSGLPSPVTSATATESWVIAGGEGLLGLEGPVAVAQQHAYRITAVIGHDDVGFAVAVQIANRHRSGPLPVAKVCWA